VGEFVVAVTGLLLMFVIRYVAITTMDHRVADRPEEQPLEGAAAPGSEHH
jgi:hypothetical protein